MPVVFDEVVGSVEPEDVAEPMEDEGVEEEPPQKPLRDLKRHIRLLEQRKARVFAD